MSRNTHWRTESLFNKWFWLNWIAACARVKPDPCTKLNSKYIKDFNLGTDTLNLVPEKVMNMLKLFDTGKVFQKLFLWEQLITVPRKLVGKSEASCFHFNMPLLWYWLARLIVVAFEWFSCWFCDIIDFKTYCDCKKEEMLLLFKLRHIPGILHFDYYFLK